MDRLLICSGDFEWEIGITPGSKIVVGNREGVDLLIGKALPDGREFFCLQRIEESWAFKINASENEKVFVDSSFVCEGVFDLPLRIELPDYCWIMEVSRKLPLPPLPELPKTEDSFPDERSGLPAIPGAIQTGIIGGKSFMSYAPELHHLPFYNAVTELPPLPNQFTLQRWSFLKKATAPILVLVFFAFFADKLYLKKELKAPASESVQGIPKNLNNAFAGHQRADNAVDSTVRENLQIIDDSNKKSFQPPQIPTASQQNSEGIPTYFEDIKEESGSSKVLTLNTAIEKANDGDAYAQAVLSFYYGLGYKTDKNIYLSAEYAIKSASQGHPLGVYRLGTMRQMGDGMDKNEAQGRALKTKAINGLNNMAGDPYAITALGVMFFQGEEIAKNRWEAARLYRMAADMGYAPAQFNFSACLIAGQGVQKDPETGLAYWRDAYNQSYPPAMGGPPK